MSRRNILLGKNLAMTPIILVICSVFLVIFEVLFPLSPTQLLATLFGMGSAFLVACIAGNQVSIVLPAAVRSGSMRSSEAKVTVVLARIAATFGMMLAFVPLFIPVTVDYLVELGWAKGIPTYLILAALLFFALLIAYRSVLNYQGALLQQRELRILQIVTTKTD